MAHIHELIDFTVAPIVVHPDQDQVLIVFHPKYGKWLSIGGHVELDENPDQALLKEIDEESGLEVEVLCDRPNIKEEGFEPLWRPSNIDIHDANLPHRHVGFVYYCLAKTADYRISDEHTEMRWFTIEELKDPKYSVGQHLIYYAEEAMALAKEHRNK